MTANRSAGAYGGGRGREKPDRANHLRMLLSIAWRNRRRNTFEKTENSRRCRLCYQRRNRMRRVPGKNPGNFGPDKRQAVIAALHPAADLTQKTITYTNEGDLAGPPSLTFAHSPAAFPHGYLIFIGFSLRLWLRRPGKRRFSWTRSCNLISRPENTPFSWTRSCNLMSHP